MEKDFELHAEETHKQLVEVHRRLDVLDQILDGVLKVQVENPTKELAVTGKVEVNTEKAVEVTNLQLIADAVKLLADENRRAIIETYKEPPEEMTVKNIAEAKADVVKIDNIVAFSDAMINSLKPLIAKLQPEIIVEKQNIVWPRSAKEAIPVRLSDGKSFYTAITQAVMSGFNTDGIITAVASLGAVPTTVVAGEKTVALVATPEALGASTTVQHILVQAKTDNTSNCFVGSASNQYVELEPGQAWAFAIDNLNKIYVKVGTNGDGVNYTGGA